MVGRAELERFVERTLGPCRVVGDRSWVHGESCVLEVRDAEGGRWFAKGHRRPEKHRSEVDAYRRWVPVLGGRAPTLRAVDDDLPAILLSAVPGVAVSDVASEMDPDVQHQAGRLLRRFHEVESLGPWHDFAAAKLDAFERWAARAAGLLAPRQLAFARDEVRRLGEVASPVRVPCHFDYDGRNWLVADGRVHVIDFEHARPEAWINDLSRLAFGPWLARPGLRDAFLDGYGRPIGDDDRAILRGCGALAAVSTVVWARDHGDAPFEEEGRQRLAYLMARRHRADDAAIG